jgi:hypothetical protein
MSGYDVDGMVLDRQSRLRVGNRPSCVVTHREIHAGDACVMLLTVPPLEGHAFAKTNDGLWRRLYAAPPILGESDGAGWLTRAVQDEARDFMLFAIGGTDWSTAKQVQQGSGLRIADGGFVSWHSLAVPTHTVFVLRRAWYELLDSAIDVFPLQMKSVAAQAEEALRLLCRSTGRGRLTGNDSTKIPIADSSLVAKVLRDSACLDLHPNTRTALWWYAQLGRQTGCLNETSVEQLISRFVQQAVFQRALSWLT